MNQVFIDTAIIVALITFLGVAFQFLIAPLILRMFDQKDENKTEQ